MPDSLVTSILIVAEPSLSHAEDDNSELFTAAKSSVTQCTEKHASRKRKLNKQGWK